MDWKILVVVVAVLLSFGIYQMCSEDDSPDWDKTRSEQMSQNQRELDEKSTSETEEKREKILDEARKLRGDRPVEATAVLESEDFRAVLTTRGGAIKSYELKDPQFVEPPRDWSTGTRLEDEEKLGPVNLVRTNSNFDTNPAYELNAPLRFEVFQGLDELLPDADYRIVERTPDRVVFRYSQPGLPVVITKKFEVDRKSGPYQIWLTTQIRNISDRKIEFLPGVIQTGYQHQTEAGGGIFSKQPNLLQGICRHNDDTFVEPWKDISQPFIGLGQIDFTGVETNYFINAMVPGDDAPATCRVSAEVRLDAAGEPLWGVARSELRWGEVSLKPGEAAILKVKSYMGPKRFQLLQSIGHDLQKSVDFGVFWPICRVLLWLLFAFQKLVVNWGVAVILLTVVVKVALIPLTHKSFKSTDRMKALKPEVDKINEQYKNDPQEKQKQTMALYKQHKVNPLGGCLPMLLQMPIWFALFSTLRTSPELFNAPFFGWIRDLSSPDPYFVTPIVMGALMFVQQQMMPMTGDGTQAKIMKYFMPIMFTGMMLFLPSGLTLYILVNTVLSIAHQMAIHRWRAKESTGRA
jgi:YidC/Oxa1 family membrane protein insertase